MVRRGLLPDPRLEGLVHAVHVGRELDASAAGRVLMPGAEKDSNRYRIVPIFKTHSICALRPVGLLSASDPRP